MALKGVTLPVVLGAALIDSINPCAIGVMILLVSALWSLSKNKKRMIFIGLTYIMVVYIVYFLAGLGLIWFQNFLIKLGFSIYLGLLIGLLSIVLGVIEIKDFFWYGKGFTLQIPAKYANIIKEKVQKVSYFGAIFLGALVAMVELPCTGGPYLAITTLLAREFNLLAVIYLIIYNFIFVLPLIIILILALLGIKATEMKGWKQKYRKYMRLAAGILLVFLGIFLILYYSGLI